MEKSYGESRDKNCEMVKQLITKKTEIIKKKKQEREIFKLSTKKKKPWRNDGVWIGGKFEESEDEVINESKEA